jgi:hypothetical protein
VWGTSDMSGAHVEIERAQALGFRETNYHVFAHHSQRKP